MPQHIFHVLRRLIGHICKKSKSRNIDKNIIHIIIPEGSDITMEVSAFHNSLCRPYHVLGQSKTSPEIIGASRGNIADRCSHTALNYACHHFVQCSITAAAHHQVISLPASGHGHSCVVMFQCGHYGNLISGSRKYIQNIGKFIPDLRFSSFWIIYK